MNNVGWNNFLNGKYSSLMMGGIGMPNLDYNVSVIVSSKCVDYYTVQSNNNSRPEIHINPMLNRRTWSPCIGITERMLYSLECHRVLTPF